MRIDVHKHFQCLDFIKHLHGRGNLPRSLLDGGTYVVQCAGGLNIPRMVKKTEWIEMAQLAVSSILFKSLSLKLP